MQWERESIRKFESIYVTGLHVHIILISLSLTLEAVYLPAQVFPSQLKVKSVWRMTGFWQKMV